MILTSLRLRRLAAAAAALTLLPAAAAAQAGATTTVQVVVRAVETSAPVRDARVELLGERVAANTDSAGVARLSGVSPGPAMVFIRKLGYGDERFPLTVPPGDTLTVEVDLQSEAVRLAEVRATAYRSRVLTESGFTNRQRMGIGSFATRYDWERRGRLHFTDVVRRMRGIRVARTANGNSVLLPMRGIISMGSMCRGVLLYVDGVMLTQDARYDDVNDLVPLAELEAVETYAGPAEIPPQFNQTGSACGAVVAWRRGAN